MLISAYFWAFIAFLSAYIAIGTAVALASRRYGVKTTAEYFVAGHRLGGVMSAMTYAATTYSAFMMVGLVGLAYATGVGALGFELSYFLVTLLILSLLGRRVWKSAREKGWVSASEMLGDIYSSKWLSIYIASLYLVALLPYISAQFIGIGKVFEGLGLSYSLGIAVAAALVLLWIVIAGMWSKATTDVFQGSWMIAAAIIFIAWLVIAYIPSKGVSLSMISDSLAKSGLSGLGSWSLPLFFSFTIPWWFFAVTNPQVVRKLFMPLNEKSFTSMIIYFGIYGLIYTSIVVMIGLLARGLTAIGIFPYLRDRDLVTPTLLTRLDPYNAAFVYVSIVAAAVTTANSIILSIAASFVRDLYEKILHKAKASITLANTLVIILTIIAGLIAYIRPSFIVEMSVLSSMILLPLAPPTIAGWILPNRATHKITKAVAEISIVTGTIITLFMASVYGPRKALTLAYFNVPLSGWILLAISICVALSHIAEQEHS